MGVNFKTKDGVVHMQASDRLARNDVTSCGLFVVTNPAWLFRKESDLMAECTADRVTCLMCIGA